MTLPTALYSAAQVRELDAREIANGTPGYTLMTRAAAGALRVMRERWPRARRVVVVCGAGNNGGDGYVLARLARAENLDVRVLAAAAPERLTGDARRAHDDWRAAGGAVAPFAAGSLEGCEVIVDALLGIGLTGAPRADTLDVIRAINGAGVPVFALDVPSGLDADGGVVAADAVRAQVTLTFVALKSGLFLGGGPEHAGEVLLDDLGIPASTPPLLRLIDQAQIASALPRRRRDSHKGTHGRVLVIGGGPGMPGAARLSGLACLRVGAGLVTVAGAPENVVAVSGAVPELIYLPVTGGDLDDAQMRAADVVAIGPGLGIGEWSQRLWAQLRRAPPAIAVIDADALNLLARQPERLPSPWILTPHPGEAARLLEVDTRTIQADRLAAVRALHEKFGAVVVLKGAGTLVASGERGAPDIFVCDRGNPGMATAGMGDVLTGVIAGIRAQCGDSALAARAGVLVHALAGDAAAQADGQRGLLASDVIAQLRRQVNR